MVHDGGQSQFSGPINLQEKASRSDIIDLVMHLEMLLHKSITVVHRADFLNISVRTLHRRCLEALDMTPAQVLSELRLDQSRNLLLQQNIQLKSIAYECGFSSSESLSTAFKLRFGASKLTLE